MFSKTSRYRKLADIVATDVNGRLQESKASRLLPDVSGTFRHTIEEKDRLDHLAYKFYKQPRKWWRICDANPEFMSPHALLGKEPMVTDRFTLNFEGNDPPWSELLKLINEVVGIENVQIIDEIEIIPERRLDTVSGEFFTIHVEHPQRAIMITYNQKNVTAEILTELIGNIEELEFEVGQVERIGRTGKKINIPTNIV